MPCLYEPSPDEIKAAEELAKKGREDLLNKIGTLTRMLCYVCAQLKDTHGTNGLYYSNLTAELQDWYEEHLKADNIRKQKIIRQALSKLTVEEREALGH